MKPLVFPVSVDFRGPHQLFVCAICGDLSVMNHHDASAAFHGGQAGGQKQDCAIITEPLPCIVEHGFGVGIEGSIRFFNDEQCGLACCGASEAESESLADIKLKSMFSECRFVTSWEAADEMIGVYQFGSFNGLLFCDVGAAAGDVFEYCGVEYRVITADEDGFFPKRFEGAFADIATINQDSTGGRVDQSGYHAGKGAGGQSLQRKQGDTFAECDSQVESIEYAASVFCFPADLVESECATEGIEKAGSCNLADSGDTVEVGGYFVCKFSSGGRVIGQ